jgi:glycine/D-amino acid oxidase-like deaminating enzyme
LISHPFWWDTVSDGNREPGTLNLEPGTGNLEPPASCDVLVVGAGYTGLAAALALARSGASVVVVEREHAGWGASSRNGGQVLTGLKLEPAALVAQHGEARARGLFDAAMASLSTLEAIIRDEQIDCEYERTGHIQAAEKPAHFDAFRQEQDLLARVFDHAVTLVAPADQARELGTRRYHGLLVDERSGAINPAKYARGLARAAARAGAGIAEHTDVLGVSRSAGAWTVKTTRGDVRAGDLLIATNGYTGAATPALRRRLIPIGSYIIVTAPLAPEVRARLIPRRRMVFDSKNFLYYFRLTGDGRLLFGGRAEFTQPAADTTERAALILERGMADVFPELAGTPIDYAWGGNVAFTRDQLPHAGKLDEAFYAGGYCGHGIAMATSLGGLMARRIAGDTFKHPLIDRPFPAIPFYNGRPWFLPMVGAYYRFRDWVD